MRRAASKDNAGAATGLRMALPLCTACTQAPRAGVLALFDEVCSAVVSLFFLVTPPYSRAHAAA